jgi:hypothetical protein
MTTTAAAGTMRIITAGCAALIAAAISSGPALAVTRAPASAPPSEKIAVDVLTVNGTGCPAGTATVFEAPDNTGFHIAYSTFIARDGGSAAPTAFRKNCQVALSVHIPQGFTLAIARADYRGRLSLAGDATALHRTNYYFQGDSDNNVFDHPFAGPQTAAWHSIDATAVEQLVWAPCGKTVVLNVNTELRVNSPKTASWISMRSSDGEADTLIQFSWKEC